MKQRTKWVLASLAAFLLVVGVLAVRDSSNQPQYRGKTLVRWFEEEYDRGIIVHPSETEDAIRAIGTNGFPLYFQWIEHPPSKFTKVSGTGINALLELFGKRPRIGWSANADSAIWAFHILGEDGQAAIPRLAQCVTNSGSQVTINAALACLVRIGEPATPVYLSFMTNPNPVIRMRSIAESSSYQFSPRIDHQLISFLQDTNSFVRILASNVLHQRWPGNSNWR